MKKAYFIACFPLLLTVNTANACSVNPKVLADSPAGMVFDTFSCRYVTKKNNPFEPNFDFFKGAREKRSLIMPETFVKSEGFQLEPKGLKTNQAF